MPGPDVSRVLPPEREENVGFTEAEQISWEQYFVDFRELIWPMFDRQGFTYQQALMFWRQEMLLSNIIELREELRG